MASRERISIIGTGLIGTSIGLGLKQANLNTVEVVGHDLDNGSAGRAKKMGAVDRTEWNLISAIEGASLVILAVPVVAIKTIMEAIAQYLPQDSVVTDTASTKVQVMQWAEQMLPAHVSFVGGHPMAGKELSGPDAAEATLFADAAYCLCPSPTARPGAVEMMTGLANLLNAKPYFVDAHEHDGLVAGVSHLPMLLSAALVSATTKSTGWREMAKLAAGGYRDATRLAASNPAMNADICATNGESIIRWIDTYIEQLREYRRLVAEGGESLKSEFGRVQEARERWMVRRGREEERSAMSEIPSTSDEMAKLFVGRKLFDATKRLDKKDKEKAKK